MYYLWFSVPKTATRSIEDVGLPVLLKNFKRHFGSNLSSLDYCTKFNCLFYCWGHSTSLDKISMSVLNRGRWIWKRLPLWGHLILLICMWTCYVNWFRCLEGEEMKMVINTSEKKIDRCNQGCWRVILTFLYSINITVWGDKENVLGWCTSQNCGHILSTTIFPLMLARHVQLRSRFW